MNKTEYKKAFSQIQPSDEVVERILEMSEKKKLMPKTKTLLVAIAVIAVLVCATFSVNAATDGAVASYVTEKASQVLPENISNIFNIVINGKKVDVDTDKITHETLSTPDGVQYEHYEYNDNDMMIRVDSYDDSANQATYGIDTADEFVTGVVETVE